MGCLFWIASKTELGIDISLWFSAVIFISVVRILGMLCYFQLPQYKRFHLAAFIVGMTLSAGLWGVADSFPNALT